MLGRRTGTNLLLLGAAVAWGVGCTSTPPATGPTTHEEAGTQGKQDDLHPNPPAPTGSGLVQVPNVSEDRARKFYVQGLDLFDQQEWDLAYREFQKSLDAYPSFYKAWFKMGLCQYNKQRYDLEIECYQNCLAIAPGYMPALLNVANAYFAKDELEKAVTAYHKVLAQEARHPVALYNLGIIYYALGEYPHSIESLQHFVDTYPSDPSKLKAESLITRSRQKWEETQR